MAKKRDAGVARKALGKLASHSLLMGYISAIFRGNAFEIFREAPDVFDFLSY